MKDFFFFQCVTTCVIKLSLLIHRLIFPAKLPTSQLDTMTLMIMLHESVNGSDLTAFTDVSQSVTA